jgi:nucleoside-diphosphate-sugar epimerase
MTAVLVTGATGFVGRHVVDVLRSTGCMVRALARRPVDTHRRDGVTWMFGDVTDPEVCAAAVRQVDVILHLAALLTARKATEYERVNVHGTATLLHAAAQQGGRVRRVVLMSSVAAMGPAPLGRVLQETDPCRPRTVYGASKLAAEHVARRLQNALPLTVLRPSFVYGPHDARGADHLRTLLQPPGRGWKTPIRELSFIHVTDLARACVRAMAADLSSGTTLLLADPACCNWEDVRAAVRMALVRLAAAGRLPPERTALFLERVKGLDVLARGTRRFESWGCDVRRARATLGFAGTRTLAAGVYDAIASYEEQGFFAPERWFGRPTTVV